MGISPYLRSLRERVGHDLILVPSAAVLVWDQRGRLLLVRATDSGLWQTIGGAVDPGESPQEAAVREAWEEARIEVELVSIRGAIGGPEFEMAYPNGDRVAYVSTVFDARVVSGEPAADGDETSDVGWFDAGALEEDLELTSFTTALLRAVGVGWG